MRPMTTRTISLFIGVLGLHTLAVFILLIAAFWVHDSVGHGPVVWLGWPLSMAVAGCLGAELKLLAGSRWHRMLPQAQLRLVQSSALILLVALMPVLLMATAQPSALITLTAGLALTLLAALTGLLLGSNGIMWLALALVFMSTFGQSGLPGLLMAPSVALGALLVVSILLFWAWHQIFAGGAESAKGFRFKAWLQNQPQRMTGWPVLTMSVGLWLILVAVMLGPDASLSWPLTASQFGTLIYRLTLVSCMLIATIGLQEMLQYRQRMRRLLMLPGNDRDRLRRGAERDLLLLTALLGWLPIAGVMLLAMYSGQTSIGLTMKTALAVASQLLILALAMRVVASRDGGVVLTALAALFVLAVMLPIVLFGVPAEEQLPAWAWGYLFCLLATAGGVYINVRAAWRRLSLEPIDHWLLVRLARQQWTSGR